MHLVDSESCEFLWHTLLNRCRPDLGALKTMCHRLRKRWDENTLLNKRPHKAVGARGASWGGP